MNITTVAHAKKEAARIGAAGGTGRQAIEQLKSKLLVPFHFLPICGENMPLTLEQQASAVHTIHKLEGKIRKNYLIVAESPMRSDADVSRIITAAEELQLLEGQVKSLTISKAIELAPNPKFVLDAWAAGIRTAELGKINRFLSDFPDQEVKAQISGNGYLFAYGKPNPVQVGAFRTRSFEASQDSVAELLKKSMGWIEIGETSPGKFLVTHTQLIISLKQEAIRETKMGPLLHIKRAMDAAGEDFRLFTAMLRHKLRDPEFDLALNPSSWSFALRFVPGVSGPDMVIDAHLLYKLKFETINYSVTFPAQ